MKRLTHLVTNIVLISSLVFLLSCSTDDNAARKDDNPVRIGIAWRGDSTAITFVSALQSVEGTPLKVTAVTKTSGIDVIEAVERVDKPFFIGLQYHPEVAVSKHANGAADASRFMDYEDALCYFQALVNYRSSTTK